MGQGEDLGAFNNASRTAVQGWNSLGQLRLPRAWWDVTSENKIFCVAINA